jgi:hypothetical protein
VVGQLRYGRSLSRTLKASHKNYRGRLYREIECVVLSTHEFDQFVVHNLHNRLSRSQATRYFLAHCATPDPIDKRLYRRQRNIGFEKRHTDIAKSINDMIFGQSTSTPEALKRLLESISQLIEHGESR